MKRTDKELPTRVTKWSESSGIVNITISTRVPTKWLFVDRETGDVWKWRDGELVRA